MNELVTQLNFLMKGNPWALFYILHTVQICLKGD